MKLPRNPCAPWRIAICVLLMVYAGASYGQDCSTLAATYTATESRCIATGTITINASGGSGSYNYKVTGPVSTSFTSSSKITGLSAGTYSIEVKDIVNGCTVTYEDVEVPGTYNDPRFQLTKTDVSCLNGSNGAIAANDLQYGRAPFTFTIMSPSPTGVGTTSSTGTFANLVSGEYAIQLTDSCGGIQTRRITLLDYDWWIDSKSVSKSCSLTSVTLTLKDNRGNVNSSGSAFDAFIYGVVKTAGDTTWFSSRSFQFDLENYRSVSLVAKDGCGNVQATTWTDSNKPKVAASVTTSNLTCSDFTAKVTGQTNLTNPEYCLYTSGGTQIDCNSTGTFNNIPYGSYCIKITDNCYDTTISRCFTTSQSIPAVAASVTVGDKACNSFKATVTGQTNLTSPVYTLYDGGGNELTQNSTGVFSGLAYGSYSVKIKDGCYDTTITRSFSAAAPVKSVAASVTVSDKDCATFTGTVTGQTNLTSPVYTLYDGGGNELTQNSTGVFSGLSYGSYTVKIKDGCYDTTITRTFSATAPIPSVGATVSISGQACSTFTGTVTGQSNLTNPQYCLYTAGDVLVDCNSTGTFSNVSYGSYCIKVTNDACYDTTITRCFTTVAPTPSAGSSVSISNKTCSTFTAKAPALTNVNNPQYCLYDGDNNLVSCNSTGTFTGLAYGSYCIYIQNDVGCYDTTIKRCFTQTPPKPSVSSTVTISNKACATFTAQIGGKSNLTSPVYTLYDSENNEISSNTSGTFNNIPYGSYCIKLVNSCYDTTITRCFSATQPAPSIDNDVTISDEGCAGFTATITGQTNLNSPQYCLYDAGNNLVSCNSDGSFTGVAYGSYCIKVTDGCYDTTMTRCFSVTRDIPSVNEEVTISNKDCSGFKAHVKGAKNLNSPQYCLYTSGGTQVDCNTSGVFNNVAYGSYCIKVTDGCYDTTITRCFTVDPIAPDFSITAEQSCAIETTSVTISFTEGTAPYTVKVYNPYNVLVTTKASSVSSITIDSLPALSGVQQYRIVAQDDCGQSTTKYITPVASTFTKTQTVTFKCPSGQWENGAADVSITVTSSLGNVVPQIIKKNDVAEVISYSTISGNQYDFVDLEPATYVMQYAINGCTGKVYDTITIAPYTFPGLQKSAAYQCNNNSFSVGASVTGGIGPFSYEIIGSVPSEPSIVTTAQSNPVFDINNGVDYSLVRLRAVDYCGNATLNDVNILPLANSIVTASSNCYYNSITLSVDSTPNATYEWYKKTSDTDSLLMGTDVVYNVSYLLPSDTGIYICKISVNGGCLTQSAEFHLDGYCGGMVLPLPVTLSAKWAGQAVQLNWVAADDVNNKTYYIERSSEKNGVYEQIGAVSSVHATQQSWYAFTDQSPIAGKGYYRLRIITAAGKVMYSNVVLLSSAATARVNIYPNPVKDLLQIELPQNIAARYEVSILNVSGQVLYRNTVNNMEQPVIRYRRTGSDRTGVYLLKLVNTTTGETITQKLLFE